MTLTVKVTTLKVLKMTQGEKLTKKKFGYQNNILKNTGPWRLEHTFELNFGVMHCYIILTSCFIMEIIYMYTEQVKKAHMNK